jgi:hypothetical protein
MNRAIWMATAFSCATAIGAAAQTPSATTSSKMDDKTVTVTGCLEDASSAPTGTAPKTGFVLANATMGSGSTSTTSGSTVGTTGTTGSAAHGTSYVLEGRDTELKSHVGHRIEVTGTIEPKSRMDPATTATPGAAAAHPSDDRLNVTSIKMVAAECTPK